MYDNESICVKKTERKTLEKINSNIYSQKSIYNDSLLDGTSMSVYHTNEFIKMKNETTNGEKGNFIFDQSPELHRALTYADAMVSDNSSVAAMFIVTSKPLLMQNCEINNSINKVTQEEYLHSDIIAFGSRILTIEEFANDYPEWHEYWLPLKNSSQCSRFVIIADYEFGTSTFLNAIYKVNERNAKAEYLASFPGDDNGAWLYHTSVRIGNKLLFTPARARCWAFYDLDLFDWSYEDVPKELFPSLELCPVFTGWTFFGDELIFLPGESGAIAKYNVDTGRITYHKEWYSKLLNNVLNANWGIISGIMAYHDSLLLTSPQANVIIELEPKTLSVKTLHKIGEDSCGFSSAYLVPNTDIVYLIKFRESFRKPWTETIVKWNIKSGKVKEITNLPIIVADNHSSNVLSTFVYWKGELFVLPLQGDSILKIELQSDEITRFSLTPEFDFFKRKSKYYEAWGKDQALPYVIFNGKRMNFIAQLPFDYGLADIDFSSGKVSNRRKWYVDGVEDLYKANLRNADSSLRETPFFTLDNFLDGLTSDKFLDNCKNQSVISDGRPDNSDGTSGQKIFSYVKNLVGGE